MRVKSPKTRTGVSSIEYVSVCALICLAALPVVSVLGQTIARLEVVNSATSGAEPDIPAGLPELPIATAHSSIAISPQLQMYCVLSACCLIALGILHVTKRKEETEKNPQTCDVKQIQKQSKALQTILEKRSSIQSILLDDWVQLFEGNAVVSTYMSRQVAAVRPDMSIEDADAKLRADGYRRIMVTDEEGRMAGVLSRKDIASKSGKTVADIMTTAPKTASPDMNLRVALSVLLQHRISCLPVVKDGYLIGLVSTSDLLIVLQCILLILSNQNNATCEVPTASRT